jgi:outer membrane protein OmpA-like peptidoglycan-associated protein
MQSSAAEVRTMACRIPALPDRLSPARSYQQEVLQALYESPELLNEGLISFEYPLYEVSDEELDYFLGSLIHQVAKTAGGVAKTVGKGISTVSRVVPMPVLTAGLSWTPLGMAARAGIGALQAAGEGRNVFQGAMRSLAADPVSRFYIDTAAAAARGENILKAAQKAAQAGIGDLRQSLQFAAMVAPFIPGIGTGVAAALSAANALAAGQPITDALIAAARGAVPGGAVAQMAFDTAMNLAKGKNIGDALLASARDKIPGGPAAQAAFDAAVALAKGRNIQDAAFAAAGRLLPPSPYAADALSFVRKIAAGQNIQRAALSTAGNAVLSRMQAMGAPPIPRAAVPVPRRLPGRPPLPRWPGLQRELYENGSGSDQRTAGTAATPSTIIARFKFNEIVAPLEEWAKLEPLARRILAGDTNVILVGHTDPVGTADYNYDLGMRRTAEVRRRLNLILERLRPGSSRSINYIPFSAGATHPFATNRTEDGRAQNRRVEVFIYGRSPVPPKPPVPPPVPKGPVPPPKPPVPPQPPWPVPKPPGPIIPWPPKDVTVQPPPSGRRHWVWDLLSSAATALGVVLTPGITAISPEVLAEAIAAAEAELKKHGPGKKGIGEAGEAAARVILEDKLGHSKRVYNLNKLREDFPLLDLITPEDCASVKTFGALTERDLASIIAGHLTAYRQGSGRDWDPGSRFRKVSQAAQVLLDNRRSIPKDALPAAISQAKSVADVERYLLDCFTLYVPSDLVKPTCEAIVKYLAKEMGIAITIGGVSLQGSRMSRAQGDFLARECRRVQSAGPSLSDFRAMVQAARSRTPAQHELYEIDSGERGLVSSQIAAKQLDAYRLTDFVFYRRHPEMRGRRIGANETQLRNEWLTILHNLVEPALKTPAPPAPAKAPAPPAVTPPPPVKVKMDESQAREWIKRALDGAHAIGSVSEVLGIFGSLPAGSAVALAAEIAVPVGYVALMAFVAIELWEAFTTGTRIQREKGFCFGIMWAALGMPDQPKNFQAWAPNTADELREAWQEGVAQGRKKFAEDIQLHNYVLLRIAYERLQKAPEPEAKVLNLIWEEVRGDDLPGTHINWTGGPDMIGHDYNASVDANYWNVPPAAHELGEIGGGEQDFVRSQIANTNQRDAYKLTDLVFYRRHPEMSGRRIGVNETQLKNEWLSILRAVVQPVLRAASPMRTNGPRPAPIGDRWVAGALAIAARPVPGMPGVSTQQLIEQWRPQIAPEIPLSVILAFLPFESGGNFDDATHGSPKNRFTSPEYYELGLFQTPAGLHGRCTTEKYQSCEWPPPGVEKPRDPTLWFPLCRKIGVDPVHDWQNPTKQMRVGLLSIECPARRIRKLFPELFPMPGTDWDLRMSVLMAFARGGGFAQAFLSHYRRDLASLPEDRRWDFLRGKAVPYRAGYYWTFDTSNVDKKMDLAAKLGYRPSAGRKLTVPNINC